MLEPWARLQAMLQGILRGAGPGCCYYKVLTGLFVIGSSFSDTVLAACRAFCSWILCLGIAGTGGPGSLGSPGSLRSSCLVACREL